MNDRQTDVKHKFQNQLARMLPLSAQQHGNGTSTTGMPTTLLLSSFTVLQVHRNRKAYDGVGAQDGHLDFHTAPELSAPLFLSWCFSSTKNVRLIRDREPGMATLTFTQLLNSKSTTRTSLASVPASSKDASQKPGQPAVHASLQGENWSFRQTCKRFKRTLFIMTKHNM